MRYLRFVLLGLLALAVMALAPLPLPGPNGASGSTTGYPDSMASLGDSITRAVNPEPSLFGDQPQYSWSTGDNSAVESHYYRILQQNSLISGNNYNDAVSGARMTHLNGQAQTAVSQGVEYVTILMGANDVCTSSEATMTPVGTFRSQFQQAMDTLTLGLPDARVFVASIPDIYRLWFILKDNSSAVFIWNTFGICQSLLANPTSTAQADIERRDRVRQRNIDFNTQLAEVCALYANCLFDNSVGFSTQFEPIHVSTLDYFHPSIAGQTLGASVSWGATFEFSGPPPTPCSGDSDCDGVADATENACGSDPNDANSIPERLDGAFSGVDDDGNDGADEALSGGSAVFDCDGDGWTGTQEMWIFDAANTANDQDPCGNDGWPADMDPNNRLNIGDFNSYTVPAGPDDGHGVFNYFGHTAPDVDTNGGPDDSRANAKRWDIEPNGVINIGDPNSLTAPAAETARPPMFGGELAFFAGECPWPP